MKRYLVFVGWESDEVPGNSGANSLKFYDDDEDVAIAATNRDVADGAVWAHVYDHEQDKIIWEA